MSALNVRLNIGPTKRRLRSQASSIYQGPPAKSLGNIIGDSDIPIAVIDDVNREVSSTSYKRQKLPAAYEALEKAEFRWTSYEES